MLNQKDFQVFNKIDCFYRNDANYQFKNDTAEVKTKKVKSFYLLLQSLIELMKQNSERKFKNQDIRNYSIQSYKKIFRFIILENAKAFRDDNKQILDFFKNNSFLDTKTTFKFFFVNKVLLPFANSKGSGIARIIKIIYD